MSQQGRVRQRTRAKLRRRQGNRCCFCTKQMTKEETTLEHILPKSKGGNGHALNLTISCRQCNSTRNDMDFETFKRKKRKELGIPYDEGLDG